MRIAYSAGGGGFYNKLNRPVAGTYDDTSSQLVFVGNWPTHDFGSFSPSDRTVNRNRRPEWLDFDDHFTRPPVRRPANVVRFERRQTELKKSRRRNRRRER